MYMIKNNFIFSTLSITTFLAPAPAAPSSGGLFGGKSPAPGGNLFGGSKFSSG